LCPSDHCISGLGLEISDWAICRAPFNNNPYVFDGIKIYHNSVGQEYVQSNFKFFCEPQMSIEAVVIVGGSHQIGRPTQKGVRTIIPNGRTNNQTSFLPLRLSADRIKRGVCEEREVLRYHDGGIGPHLAAVIIRSRYCSIHAAVRVLP